MVCVFVCVLFLRFNVFFWFSGSGTAIAPGCELKVCVGFRVQDCSQGLGFLKLQTLT